MLCIDLKSRTEEYLNMNKKSEVCRRSVILNPFRDVVKHLSEFGLPRIMSTHAAVVTVAPRAPLEVTQVSLTRYRAHWHSIRSSFRERKKMRTIVALIIYDNLIS